MSASESGHTSARPGHVQQALSWIRGGWRLLQQDRPLWIGMAAIYLVLGALLEIIPFAGHLLLVLLSPMLLAGALYALPPAGTGSAPRASAVDHIRAPARQLLQAFASEARVYPAVLMGILVVGLVVLIAIAQYLIGAGSFTAEVAAARHGVAQTAAAAARLLASGVMYGVLIMALFYAVHRTVYGHREPMTAIAESFVATKQQAPALAIVALVFAVPYVAVAAAFQAAAWLGYVALFSVGLVALPVLVLASYCGYLDAYGER